jgi:hypothetical protein
MAPSGGPSSSAQNEAAEVAAAVARDEQQQRMHAGGPTNGRAMSPYQYIYETKVGSLPRVERETELMHESDKTEKNCHLAIPTCFLSSFTRLLVSIHRVYYSLFFMPFLHFLPSYFFSSRY